MKYFSAKKNCIDKKMNNSKQFWKIVNNITGRSNKTTPITSLLTTLNCKSIDVLANLINNKFKETFILSDKQSDITSNGNEDILSVTEEEVFLEISKLRIEKAYPKSDLHPRLYLEAILSLSPILCNIFNHSLAFLKWLQSYLTNRKQQVRINTTYSEIIDVTSGVLQRSSLSPYLYSLFVADLQSNNVHLVKFADDTTYLFTIRKDRKEKDLETINCEIKNLEFWTTRNKSVINVDKSKLIFFTKMNPLKHNLPTEIRGIRVCTDLKLLGVTFTNNLSFKTHFDAIVKQASQRLHFLRVMRRLIPKSELWRIYNCLIRSILEYACQLFVSLPKSLCKNLETIQKRAHKIICNTNHQCDCNIVSLEDRRNFLAVRLFKNIMATNHPLHTLLPKLSTTNRWIVPIINTCRRRDAFFVKCIILLNNIKID